MSISFLRQSTSSDKSRTDSSCPALACLPRRVPGHEWVWALNPLSTSSTRVETVLHIVFSLHITQLFYHSFSLNFMTHFCPISCSAWAAIENVSQTAVAVLGLTSVCRWVLREEQKSVAGLHVTSGLQFLSTTLSPTPWVIADRAEGGCELARVCLTCVKPRVQAGTLLRRLCVCVHAYMYVHPLSEFCHCWIHTAQCNLGHL